MDRPAWLGAHADMGRREPSLFVSGRHLAPSSGPAAALFKAISVILIRDERRQSLPCRPNGDFVPMSALPFSFVPCLAAGAVALCSLQVLAQERIYRCGNEYTNNAQVAKSRNCSPMEGGNITIVEGVKTAPASRATPAAAPRSGADRVDPNAQRARDSDAKVILEAELRKAEERLAQARKEYANGEPEKQGIESRNYQRYLDRVAELKAAVARAESDVAGLQRELGRLPAAPGNAAK